MFYQQGDVVITKVSEVKETQWQEVIRNQGKIICTKEEYQSLLRTYLMNECIKYDINGNKDLSKYLSNEIKRLDETFKGE